MKGMIESPAPAALSSEEHPAWPDVNRLSVLTSTILLAYALTPLVDTQERVWNLNLPGAVFAFSFDLGTLVAFAVAGLAAVGCEWLLRGHPRLGEGSTLPHWLVPMMTAWAIGVTLNTLEVGVEWWAMLALGALLLILVFIAEYVVVDLSGALFAPAMVGLTAVAFALFLILSIAMRAAELRLYLQLPAMVLALFLVVLRALYLRLGGRWAWGWAAGIALVTGQMAIGLHYLPLRPIAYGLILLGTAYALTSAAGAWEEGRPKATLWIEPALMLTVLWALAFWWS